LTPVIARNLVACLCFTVLVSVAAPAAPIGRGVAPSSSETPTAGPSSTATPGPTPTPIVSGAIRLYAPQLQGCASFPLTAHFTATSRVDLVTEMRTVRPYEGFASSDCGNIEDKIRDRPWEPFATQQTYEGYGLAHTFQLSVGVQYRDGQGNVSPVYCDATYGVCFGTATAPPPGTATRTRTPTPSAIPSRTWTPTPVAVRPWAYLPVVRRDPTPTPPFTGAAHRHDRRVGAVCH
jgi:hypothetical protein